MAHPIHVNFELSPRIITVEAPEVEITIQDLHDNLVDIEDSIEGHRHPRLILTAGKEDLGGGTSVGLTATLQNAQLAFERRVVKLENGTITTPDTNGVTLIDSAATFQTNGVQRGDIVRNHTDSGSVASVLSVDSETQLTTDGLSGGTDDQFNSSDMYDVLDLVQCNITGGNLVAVDDVQAVIDPVFPTFGTQIVRTSSSSATAIGLTSLQFSQYQDTVAIDVGNTTGNAVSGTEFPVGTRSQPVDNIADMVAILTDVGLQKVFVYGDLTISNEADWSDFTFIGQSPDRTTITVGALATTAGTEFEDCEITGTVGDELTFRRCRVGTATLGNGEISNTGLVGPITLDGASGQLIMVDCHCASLAGATPIIDCNGDNIGFTMHNYKGDVKFTNKTGMDIYHVGVNGGHVILDSTIVAAGSIKITGVFETTDNSIATVIDRGGDVIGKLQTALDIVEGDEYYDGNSAIRRHKTTKAILFQKLVSGGQITNPPITITQKVPGAIFTDSFTDTFGTLLEDHTPELGGPWTMQNGIIKIENDIAVTDLTGPGLPLRGNLATFETTVSDGSIEADFNTTSGYHSIILRYSDVSNYMEIWRSQTNLRIYSFIDGIRNLNSDIAHGQDGQGSLRAEFNGLQIDVYSQDILLAGFNNATHNQTETTHGFSLRDPFNECDNYTLTSV